MHPDPRHESWGDPPLPSWLSSFRPQQLGAVARIADSFTRVRHVILDAPTGVGKTLVAEATRRHLGVKQALYTCTTRTLQEQFIEDYPYARVLKGRANYPTELEPTTTCDACTWDGDSCMWCVSRHSCPYNQAKQTALTSPLAVLNTAYLLTEANGPGFFGRENRRDLVVLDEADELESTLMGHVTVELGQWWQKRLHLQPPQTKTADAASNDWQQWVDGQAIPKVARELAKYPAKPTDPKVRKRRDRTARLLSRLRLLSAQLPEGGWVYDGYKRGTIIFKPIKVDKLAPDLLWQHGKRFLLMSGSVISSGEMADALGIDDYETVTVPSTWDPANRPIHFLDVADLTYKNRHTTEPQVAKATKELCVLHPGERILVHTNSYRLAKTVYAEVRTLDRPTFSYFSASDRETALDKYKANPGAVVVAASFDRGVDLPGELCLAEGTKVYMADLSWKSIEDVEVGDEVIGIDEDPPRPRAYRALRYAKVEDVGSRVAKTFRVETTKGDIFATAEHPFLCTTLSKRTAWRTVEDLRTGWRIRWVAEPVQREDSFEAGWVSGFFDGEGCASSTRHKNGTYRRHTLSVVQRYGPTLDKVIDIMERRGFELRYNHRENAGSDAWDPSCDVAIGGNLSERLRFLSTFRPERLITNFAIDGASGRDQFAAEILSIEPAGERRVHNLTTSTGTFFANGMAVHNCRVMVVCKVPWPSLGDKAVSARRYQGRAGKAWYAVSAMRSLVQMLGRGVRSEDDHCVTYILDGAVRRLPVGMFPPHIREAIK